MANWAVATIAGFSFVVLFFDGAVDVLLGAAHRTPSCARRPDARDGGRLHVHATDPLEDQTVLFPRPRRRIGRPRPQRPGPRYPQLPARRSGAWSR
ncbi:hypothetical protein [Streptomyces chrestomyceticus]|uniref:hypothetical protein n=1 Tax=Streptomyces chrestomyceticus TaxID=68185 RepID=UPI0035A8DBFE